MEEKDRERYRNLEGMIRREKEREREEQSNCGTASFYNRPKTASGHPISVRKLFWATCVFIFFCFNLFVILFSSFTLLVYFLKKVQFILLRFFFRDKVFTILLIAYFKLTLELLNVNKTKWNFRFFHLINLMIFFSLFCLEG